MRVTMTRLLRARRSAALTIAIAVTAAVLAMSTPRPRRAIDPGGAARASALQLFDAALGERTAGRYGAARQLLRDAFAADPSWPLPAFEFPVDRIHDDVLADMRAIGRSTSDRALAACLGALLDYWTPPPNPDSLGSRASPAARRCSELLRVRRSDLTYEQRVATIARLRRVYLKSPVLLSMHLDALIGGRGFEAAAAEGRQAFDAANPAIMRAEALRGMLALHALGRHAEAMQWERAAARIMTSAGPGAQLVYYRVMVEHFDERFWPAGDTAAERHARQVIGKALAGMSGLTQHLDPVGRALLLNLLFQAKGASGDIAGAAEAARRGAALADSIGARNMAATMLARHGQLLVKLGRLSDAEVALTAAGTRARQLGDLQAQREAAHHLLHLREARGRYAEAVAAGVEFRRVAEAGGHRPGRMMAHHDLAWLHLRHGETRLAQQAFAAMVADIARMNGEYTYFAGEYYELIGALELARRQYLAALPYVADRARALSGMVRVSQALGDTAAALYYARLSDRQLHSRYPEYRVLLPGVLAQLGRYDEARTALEQTRAHAAARGLIDALARHTIELSELRLRIGQPLPSATLADTAAQLAASLGVRELELEARALAAAARAHVHRKSAAVRREYAEIVRGVSRLRAPQLAARVHRLRGDAFAATGAVDEALSAYLRAAAWTDTVAARLHADHNRATYRAAQIEVSNRAIGLIARTGGKQGVARYASLSLWRKGAGRKAGDAHIATLRRRLGAHRALIDYGVLDTLVTALVVTADGATLHILPITADTLTARIQELRAGIAPRVGTAIDIRRIGFDADLAQQLYSVLLEPLLPALGGRHRLVIVADRQLHALPMDALVIRHSAADTTYVLDLYTTSYASSLAVGLTTEPISLAHVIAVAGSGAQAVGAIDEVASIAKVVPDKVTVIRDAEPEAMRRAAEIATVLHFATHAEANDREPQFARLLTGKGWLHAYEVNEWKLRGTLVVLSACDTGAGLIAGGEGTLSLSRAFLRAGASGAVATLWPVGAPTSHLMNAFYTALAEGRDPAEALRDARLTLRNGDYRQPFYWAPFTLTSRDL